MSLTSRQTLEKQPKNASKRPCVLATDLDGTLIPLDGNDANRRDLQVLAGQLTEQDVTLTFVTGRHLAIVETAIDLYHLPRPKWIICDVGSTIYRDSPQGWQEIADYRDHLASLCAPLPLAELHRHLSGLDSLTLQEEEKQRPFKLSFYVEASSLDASTAQVVNWIIENDAPWSHIASIDPFTGNGLIDLLPRGVSKAFALEWWREHCGFATSEIVFAGDSGNDLAALIAGYRSIIVVNADRQLAAEVELHHKQQSWTDRLFLATEPATSGVLQGTRAFGLLPTM